MATPKDQEIDRAVRKVRKASDEPEDGVMPQCKIRHKMSSNKTLWDMLNDDAMKKNIYIASMNKCQNKSKHQ